MARNWKDVRGDAVRAGLDEQAVENARKEMLDEVRAYRLADIRNEQHLSQSDVALRMKVSQPRVSAIERGELGSTELGTLEAYVEALGGKVRIVAQFGDDALTIGG